MRPDNAQAISHRPSQTPWVAYCALFISTMTFIFGNNIGSRLFALASTLQTNNNTIVEAFIALINIALAIFVLLDLRIFHQVKLQDDSSPALSSFKQLLNGWKLLWITWILFYGCLAAQWFQLFSPNIQKFVSPTEDALNLINGFFFYYLFFVLDQPSVASESDPNRAESFRQNNIITAIFGVMLFVISTAWWDKGELLSKLIPAYIAVGMAFFFGRLDSHYLKLKRVVLAPLYLYAVIQLYWGRDISDTTKFNHERVSILILALILKFAIFYILSRLFRDEKFRRYFTVAEEGLKRAGAENPLT